MSVVARAIRYAHRAISRPLHLRRLRRLGIRYLPPNYVYFDTFCESSIVVDVGCGSEAEFSMHMIETYGLRAFGVDPTRKHARFLRDLEQRTKGKFRHLPLAVSEHDGVLTFHESGPNESGSILSTHTNIQNDHSSAYDVESVSLRRLVQRLGLQSADFLKLDLEGAEYELFDGLCEADLLPFAQIFLECHHHCTPHTFQETTELVDRVCGLGFAVFTLDRHNFLFYRQK